VEQIPTVHLGVAAAQMERRGIRTERGDRNREIEVTNKRLQQLRARIRKLQGWLKTEAVNTEPPTLYDVISEILNRGEGKTQWQRIHDLQSAASLLVFLQQNKIKDVADLEKHLATMVHKQLSVSADLKPIDKRLGDLAERIKHSANFKQYRGYKTKYEKLYAEYKTIKKSSGLFVKQKAQKALDAANEYHRAHYSEITLYENAEQYLKDVLQSHYDPKKLTEQVTRWKAEQTEKLATKAALNIEYKNLKAEVHEVETIRRSVDQILHANRAQQRARAQGMEL